MSSSTEIYRTMLLNLLNHPQFMNVSRSTLIAHPKKDKVAVIIDPRFDDLMEAVIRNVMYFLSQHGYNLMILSDARYSGAIREKFPHCLFVPLDPQMVYEDESGVPNLSRDMYNGICTSEEFWTHVPGEHVVVFQKDCIMYQMFPEHYSQVFDFCGANYFHPRDCVPRYGGINGGFSLRKRSAMLECIHKIRIETIMRYRRTMQKRYTYNLDANVTTEMMRISLPMNEDIFFSHACELLNKRVPDTFHRSYFAVEADANPDTAGHHGWDKEYHPVDIAFMLLNKSEFWHQRIARGMPIESFVECESYVPMMPSRESIQMPLPPPDIRRAPFIPRNTALDTAFRPFYGSPPAISTDPPSPGNGSLTFSGTIRMNTSNVSSDTIQVVTQEKKSVSNHLSGLTQMYYINLDRCTQRREYMEQHVICDPMFQEVCIERISACDGVKDDIDEFLEFRPPYQKTDEVTDLEYACTISHFRAIEALSMTDPAKVPFALIVEDDLSLEFVPYWTQTLQECLAGCPSDWEIVQLSYIPIESAIHPSIAYDVWDVSKQICGATAYLITHAAATKIMSGIKLESGRYGFSSNISGVAIPQQLCAKRTMQLPQRAILSYKADWLIYSLLRTYTVNPPLFTYRDDNDSNIHPEHVIHQAESKNKTRQVYFTR